jgi:hypothetical protein
MAVPRISDCDGIALALDMSDLLMVDLLAQEQPGFSLTASLLVVRIAVLSWVWMAKPPWAPRVRLVEG